MRIFLILSRGIRGLEARKRRGTGSFKPSADVDLRVRFPAIMPGAGGIRCLRVPLQHGELRFTALDHKPVDRIAAHGATNLTAELLKKGHLISSPRGAIAHSSVYLAGFGRCSSPGMNTMLEHDATLLPRNSPIYAEKVRLPAPACRYVPSLVRTCLPTGTSLRRGSTLTGLYGLVSNEHTITGTGFPPMGPAPLVQAQPGR